MLTDSTIRTAKPQDRPYKLADGCGLHLHVAPAGGKWWRLRYRCNGREQMLSLGIYPDVTLKEARQRRDEIRRQLTAGIDPSAARKAQQASAQGADSFDALAREWFGKLVVL